MFQSLQFSYYSKTNNPFVNGMRPRGFFSERKTKILREILLRDPGKDHKVLKDKTK